MRASLAFILCGLLLGCVSRPVSSANASFTNKVSMSGKIQLKGWARLHGEFEIYSDRESFDHELKFPNCISGVFSDQAERTNLSQYDGKLITVIGELFRYADLPDEDRPVVPRKLLADSVIPNWCYGSNVLLIKSIKFESGT